jgi:hypothetical protein
MNPRLKGISLNGKNILETNHAQRRRGAEKNQNICHREHHVIAAEAGIQNQYNALLNSSRCRNQRNEYFSS